MKTNVYFIISFYVLLRMEKVSDKISIENQNTHILYLITIF